MIGNLWNDLWPNMVAPSVWTILAIIVSHMLHRKAMATHVDHLRTHITERLHHQSAAQHAEMGRQLAAHCADVKEHVSAQVAESQVSGGSTPFESRERLDGPPATGRRRRGERM